MAGDGAPARTRVNATAEPIANRTASPWIYRPWLDLTIGCGGWSAPLLLLAAWLGASHLYAGTVAFYALALVFNYPHFMATVYRAYHTRTEFARYRIFTLHMTALLVLTGVLAHFDFRLLPWVFTLYIDWSPWHYTGQNFGLLMMFVRRGGTQVKPVERHLLHLAFIASYMMLLLSFHTGASGDPMILSLGLTPKVSVAARLATGAAFAVLSAWVFARWTRQSGLRALAPAFTLLVSQSLWFVLPTAFELVSRLSAPQTRYSSGVLAVLHSAQYLWITSYYARREARAVGQASWRMTAYFGTLLAGGIALFIPGPWLVSYVFHYDFAASFLIFTALVNIHHFILDGAIWKLRDSRIASLLIDRSERRAPASGEGAGRWLGGRTPAAHAVRVVAAAVLFLWGGLDQVRFFFTSDEGNLPHLMNAVRLTPYDSSLQLRLARVLSQTGRSNDALEALGRAVTANPANPVPQHARARALIEAQRFAEAHELYRQMLVRFPRDADALVNFGLLAGKMGRLDEAVESWQKALDLDPNQMNAQLYLAEALDQQGRPAAAARHYEAYLELAAAHPDALGAALSQRAAAMVKLGDAYAHVGQAEKAFASYRAATALAAQGGDARNEGVAHSHLAEALDAAGQPAAAARAYQRALALDARSDDRHGEAIDWFNYGQFLRRRGAPGKLAYACFLRAETLLKSAPGSDLDTVSQIRGEMEASLGREASAVRGNLAAVVDEAIAVSDFPPARN